MRKPIREFSDEFKLAALREVERGRSVHEVAGELDGAEKSIYRWQKEFAGLVPE